MRGVLYLIFRLICYVALAVVLSGFAALALVSLLGACPNLSTGSVSCTSPFYQSVAEYGISIVLVTVFTGLPGLLAIAGAVFAIRKVYLWRTSGAPQQVPQRSEDAPGPDVSRAGTEAPPRSGSGFGRFVLKGVLILLAAAFVAGAISAVVERTAQ